MPIRAILVQPLIVLVKIINLFDCLELLLQLVFNFKWKTTPVVIKNFAQIFTAKVFLKCLAQGMEDHSHVEASQTSFKTNFVSSLFENDLFALILFISVIKLWDLEQNPKCLPIELFTKVSV